jgi:hypothetical protein
MATGNLASPGVYLLFHRPIVHRRRFTSFFLSSFIKPYMKSIKKTTTKFTLLVQTCLVLMSAVQCFVPTHSQSRTNRWTTLPLLSTATENFETDNVENDGRRKLIKKSLYFGMGAMFGASPVAAEETVSSAVKQKAFDQVRFELEDPAGGISIMQKLIDDQNWASLLDFTKTYDQVLRKAKMGAAKKLLPKESQDAATLAANGVTFDLIGINRASRKGQESAELANKYLNELRDDVKALLALQEITL